METQAIIAVVGIIVVVLMAICGALVKFGFDQGRQTEQIEKIRHDLDLVMSGIMNRGQMELVNKNMASFHSPFHLGQMSVEALLPFVEEFIPFYMDTKRANPEMTDQQFFWLLEEKFGNKVMEKICATQGLSNFGCLSAILEICKLKGDEHAT